jgi:hypothetical protein
MGDSYSTEDRLSVRSLAPNAFQAMRVVSLWAGLREACAAKGHMGGLPPSSNTLA